MFCGIGRAVPCTVSLRLVGWTTLNGAAHVVCRGYPGSYPPQDGNPSPDPDPRKPAPNITGSDATQIGPRRPSTGLSIYAKSNPNPSALLSPQPPAPHSATPAAARAPSADVANGSDVIHAIARALACVCTATPATLAESQPVSLSRLPSACRMPCACSDDAGD